MYVELFLGGQSSFHVETTLLVFQYCVATGALSCMCWEIQQKLAELHSTVNVPLTPTHGILYTGHTPEDGQLQSDDNWKLEDTDVGNIIYWLFLHICFLFFLIFCLYVSYYSLITIGLSTLEHFWCGFLYTVFVSICTSYKLIVFFINISIFENIHLLHNYYIIIEYLQDAVITLFLPMLFSLFLIIFLYLIMNWSIWVLVEWSSFPVDCCIKFYCMFVDMGELCLYIFTHVCL